MSQDTAMKLIDTLKDFLEKNSFHENVSIHIINGRITIDVWRD
jgi:hypothetical protein